jgi:hypothetical protein
MTADTRKMVIASIAPTIAAIASLIVSAISGCHNASKIEVVRLDVNDKMQRFIELAQKSSFAEGEKSERDKKP